MKHGLAAGALLMICLSASSSSWAETEYFVVLGSYNDLEHAEDQSQPDGGHRILTQRRDGIAGAGLDVFENEPAVEPRLLALDNVVLVPHIGSASIETRTRMCTMAAENAVAVLSDQRPPNPVNPEVLER